MSRKIFVSSTLLALALGLLWLTGSSGARAKPPALAELAAPQPPVVDCNDKKAIYIAIYNLFKTDPNLNGRDQLKHLNVSFVDAFSDKRIRMRGFVFPAPSESDKRSGVNQAVALARAATKCVKNVDNKLVHFRQINCPDGRKECGDICIPIAEDCNIPPPTP